MLANIHPRTVRPDADGKVRASFVSDGQYCKNPLRYIRAARVIAKDLDRLFDYVEPSNTNLPTHSFEILGLLTRTCFEVEANLKGILLANGFQKKAKDMNMSHYRKTQQSHFLSRYHILFPQWADEQKEFQPFKEWSEETGAPLEWYKKYNSIKHDTYRNFNEANFETLCFAFAGLVALLSSQFWQEDTISSYSLSVGEPPRLKDHRESLVSGFWFRISPDFTEDQRYPISKQVPLMFKNFEYN